MTKQLPPSDLTAHLQWKGKPIVERKYVRPLMCIDDIFRKGGILQANSLLELYHAADGLVYAENGLVASLPEFVEMQTTVGKDDTKLLGPFITSSEEIMGRDTLGVYTNNGGPIVLVFHGAGLIKPKRVNLNVSNRARFTQEEFDQLIKEGDEKTEGKIPIFGIDSLIQAGQAILPRYGVAVPYDLDKIKHSGQNVLSVFKDNPLVIARAGGREFLEKYYEKNRNPITNHVVNDHHLEDQNFDTPEGVILESAEGFTVTNLIERPDLGFPRYWIVRGQQNG